MGPDYSGIRIGNRLVGFVLGLNPVLAVNSEEQFKFFSAAIGILKIKPAVGCALSHVSTIICSMQQVQASAPPVYRNTENCAGEPISLASRPQTRGAESAVAKKSNPIKNLRAARHSAPTAGFAAGKARTTPH